MKIVLASKSPRRKQILEDHGYDFIVDVSDVDESIVNKQDIREQVVELAKLKALEVAKRHKNAIILAADTLVSFEGEQLGQAPNEQEAEKVLRRLMGNRHEVYSGVCVINTQNNKMLYTLDTSKVTLNKVSDELLYNYLKSGQYKQKAGAYNIDDPEFESFVGNVEGCFHNIKGMPIDKVKKMIEQVQD